METVEVVRKFGAKDVYVGCTHGVLSGPAIERIKKSEVKELVMTNTIPLPEEKQIDKKKDMRRVPHLFGFKNTSFEFLEKEPFETEYGVKMIKVTQSKQRNQEQRGIP